MERRHMLRLTGAAAAATYVAACGGDSKSKPTGAAGSTGTTSTTGPNPTTPTSAGAAAPSCVLTPEQTEGPYYLSGEATRSDITEGKPGVPLRLALTVVDASSCKPIPGATVEVWHADAAGNYSGFGGTTSNRTFLRGGQNAGADGKVTIKTIYPGWYEGRAVHIHVKTHVGGASVHTGQLYFEDRVNREVYARSPYSDRSGQWLTNAEDGIYRSGGPQSTLTIAKDGDGYVGTLTLGVRRS